jgi:hypothetical protein
MTLMTAQTLTETPFADEPFVNPYIGMGLADAVACMFGEVRDLFPKGEFWAGIEAQAGGRTSGAGGEVGQQPEPTEVIATDADLPPLDLLSVEDLMLLLSNLPEDCSMEEGARIAESLEVRGMFGQGKQATGGPVQHGERQPGCNSIRWQ